ncbi:MAG: GntR family transcriptional regulator [Betaproteobacteria bacterium]|nr:GntR family transcriptional regulator [Betaproteobacteria bacterium]
MTTSNHEPAQCAGPDLKPRAPSFKMPDGTTDCHAHVFGAKEKYGWAGDRLYTPPPVFLKDYLAMLNALGSARGVIVQSGVHGTNNDVLVDSIAQSNGRLRGIALIPENISDAELDRLNAAGVRGFRANLVAGTGVQFDASRKLAARVARLGWHVQYLLDIEKFPDLDRVLGDFPVEVMIDHMGRPETSGGTDAPGFQALIRFLKSGRGWSKLSAPYRTSREAPPYADITKFAHALVAAAPDRLVWGTDWPHVMMEGAMPNTGIFAELLATWVPDEAVRKRILVDNPARLYGFR